MRSKVFVLCVAATCLSLSGCSGFNESERDRSEDEATLAAEHERWHALQRGIGVGRTVVYDDITDLLPNVRYRRADGEARSLSDVVVHGKITTVEPDFGFFSKEGTDNIETVVRTNFNDAMSQWKTVRLGVTVFDTVGNGRKEVNKTVAVGLATNSEVDIDRLRAGLLAMDSSLFFLYVGSPVFSYDDTLLSIRRDGALLTEVTDGQLSLPAFMGPAADDSERTEGEELLQDADTLQELRDAARRPTVTRELPPAPTATSR